MVINLSYDSTGFDIVQDPFHQLVVEKIINQTVGNISSRCEINLILSSFVFLINLFTLFELVWQMTSVIQYNYKLTIIIVQMFGPSSSIIFFLLLLLLPLFHFICFHHNRRIGSIRVKHLHIRQIVIVNYRSMCIQLKCTNVSLYSDQM